MDKQRGVIYLLLILCPMQNARHLPGLNSLRFLAFLSIYLFHTSTVLPLGYLGIPVFYVLSSFLLTYLAYEEIKQTGKFSRKNFFIRRSLRIYPLYFLVIFFSLVILPPLSALAGLNITQPEEPWKYWLFLSNFENSDHLYALKFLWSISIEEQFYIFFIFFSYSFFSNSYLPIIFLYALHFTGPLFNEFVSPYYNPLTYLAEFATGILAARLYSKYPSLINNRYLIPIALVTLTLSIISFLNANLEWLFHFWFSWSVAAFILLIIINLRFSKFNNPAFNITEKLGKLTYGLYVYSGFVITFSEKIFPGMNIYLKGVIQFTALLGIAHLSYRVLEKPFLTLKKYFRYTAKTESN